MRRFFFFIMFFLLPTPFFGQQSPVPEIPFRSVPDFLKTGRVPFFATGVSRNPVGYAANPVNILKKAIKEPDAGKPLVRIRERGS